MKKLFLAMFLFSAIACVRNTEPELLNVSVTPTPNKASNNWIKKASWSTPLKAFVYNVKYNNISYELTYCYASNLFFQIKNVKTTKTVTFSKVQNGTKVQSGNMVKIYLSGQVIPLLEWLTPDMLEIFHIDLLAAKGIGGKDLIQHFSPGQWNSLASQIYSLDAFCDIVEEVPGCMQSFECYCGDGFHYTVSCPCEETMQCEENWTERCHVTSSDPSTCETYDFCVLTCVL